MIDQRLIGASASVDGTPSRDAMTALRHPQARMTGFARLNQFTASTSLARAVNFARRRPEWKLIPLFRLRVKPAARRRAMLPQIAGWGCVLWPASTACADISGPALRAVDRRQGSRSRAHPDPVPTRRAPAPGQSM